MELIENKQFDEERSLYNLQNTEVRNCIFAGVADGESVLKEARTIKVSDSNFSLRYPLWHVKEFELNHSVMDDKARAALWYCENGKIKDSRLMGIKAIRECRNITFKNCEIDSEEFGWKCNEIHLEDTSVNSQYIFLDSNNVSLRNVKMKGKYSFQYMKNLVIEDSVLDTKDAFWHSENVTVKNSIVKGEYLGWFSKGLTLINCKIIGTQPLCYCENLKLVDCTMENCDLSFEYSQVEARVLGYVDSIKNPRAGVIDVDSVGEIIWCEAVMECNAEVKVREKA